MLGALHIIYIDYHLVVSLELNYLLNDTDIQIDWFDFEKKFIVPFIDAYACSNAYACSKKKTEHTVSLTFSSPFVCFFYCIVLFFLPLESHKLMII